MQHPEIISIIVETAVNNSNIIYNIFNNLMKQKSYAKYVRLMRSQNERRKKLEFNCKKKNEIAKRNMRN